MGGAANSVQTLRAALRQALAETPTDRIGLMSEGGFTARGEIIADPHVQHMVNGRWAQLGFDEAVHSMPYEGVDRLRVVRKLVRQTRFHLDTAEKNIFVRCLNIVGYIVTGAVSIWAFFRLL